MTQTNETPESKETKSEDTSLDETGDQKTSAQEEAQPDETGEANHKRHCRLLKSEANEEELPVVIYHQTTFTAIVRLIGASFALWPK